MFKTKTVSATKMIFRHSVLGLVGALTLVGSVIGQFSDYRSGFLVQVTMVKKNTKIQYIKVPLDKFRLSSLRHPY